MNSHCFDFSVRRGLTLVEVIASLAIVSTLLVGLLVAGSRHADQIRRSRRMLDVIARVDALLYEWAGSGGLVLKKTEGELPGEDGLIWRTRPADTRYRQELGIDLVRFEVFSRDDTLGERPLVSLELAVPSAVQTAKAGAS